MAGQTCRKGLRSVGVLLLSAAAGCAVTVQPLTRPGALAAAATGQPSEPPGGHGPYPPGILPSSGPRQQAPNANPQTPQTSYSNPPMGNVNAESVVVLIKQLNEAEDGRRILQDQVQTLRKNLKERDDNVRQASFEIEESSKQIRRTRDDFRQWQAEMEELRERVRKLEDGRAALRPLIEDILHQLDRDRSAFKLTVPSQPAR